MRLNCASTTAAGSGSALTVTWNVTFKQAYSGKTYNVYLKVRDDTGGVAGWTMKGTYIVNNNPSVSAITPSSGIGQVDSYQTFAADYTDLDGWQNIRYADFLMNTSRSVTNCLFVRYNQNTNRLFLRNDANTAWVNPSGDTPGSAVMLENSYAKLDCGQTTVSGSGDTLTVNWRVAFKSTFLGAKKSYLYVKDDALAYQGWRLLGTWTISDDTTPPQVAITDPQDGSVITD